MGSGRNVVPAGDGRRRLAAVLVVLVATLASVATTPGPEDHIRLHEPGPGLSLGPGSNEATVHVSFDATDAALERFDSLDLEVRYETFWRLVPSERPLSLDVEVVKTDGPETHWHRGERLLACRSGADCVGGYDLVIRWPEALEEGSVRVAWEATAILKWDERAPAGSDASLAVALVDGVATERVFEGSARGDGTPVAAHEVTVTATAPIPPETDIAVELAYGSPTDRTSVHLLQEDREPEPLASQSTVPVVVPDPCRDAPCDFSFGLVVQGRGVAGAGPWLSYGVTTTGDPGRVEVSVIAVDVPAIETPVELGSLKLERIAVPEEEVEAHVATVVVDVHVAATALPGDALHISDPIVGGRLLLVTDREASAFSPAARIGLRASIRSPSHQGGQAVAVEPSPSEGTPLFEPVPLAFQPSCQPDNGCDFELILNLVVTGAGQDPAQVELDPELDLVLYYPGLRKVPAGAALEAGVGGSS